MSILDSLHPPPDLRVLVTAGASGIGAAIARAFHESGARVHVCDIDRAALDRMTVETPGITGSMADASVAADVDLVFDDVRGALGGLDVLVNNAGIAGPTGADRGHRRHRLGTHDRGQSQQPVLLRAAGGAAVAQVRRGSEPDLDGFGRGPARLCAAHAVRVEQVGDRRLDEIARDRTGAARHSRQRNPPRAGRRRAHARGDRRARRGRGRRRRRDAHAVPEKISLRRMVTTDDVAAMALFLCSPAARNLTGQAISVDGNVEYL